jgi:hypothetical protein
MIESFVNFSNSFTIGSKEIEFLLRETLLSVIDLISVSILIAGSNKIKFKILATS